MGDRLVPDAVYGSIYQLDPEKLNRCGVRLLLADLDNTLGPYRVPEPCAALREWERMLREEYGIRLFILSNSRGPDRARIFAESLGVPYIYHAGKPHARSYFRAMEQAGAGKGETLMLGDQIFTDVWGAHNAGIPAVLVRPIRLWGNPGRYLRYAAEIPFRLLGRLRGKPYGDRTEEGGKLP